MWELTKRMSLRTSSVLSKVEPEPDLLTGSGSDQKVPTPAPQHWTRKLHLIAWGVQWTASLTKTLYSDFRNKHFFLKIVF